MADGICPEKFFEYREIEGIGNECLTIGADLSARVDNSRNDGLSVLRFLTGVLGISATRLAAHLKVGDSTFSKYRRGSESLPIKHRVVLAGLLYDLHHRLQKKRWICLEVLHENGGTQVPADLRASHPDLCAQMFREGAVENRLRRAQLHTLEGWIAAAEEILAVEREALEEILGASVAG